MLEQTIMYPFTQEAYRTGYLMKLQSFMTYHWIMDFINAEISTERSENLVTFVPIKLLQKSCNTLTMVPIPRYGVGKWGIESARHCRSFSISQGSVIPTFNDQFGMRNIRRMGAVSAHN